MMTYADVVADDDVNAVHVYGDIDADDVECSHGCTIGQLDAEQIHYLKSRGFSEDEARSILIFGFAKDIADSISNNEIKQRVEKHIRNKTKTFIEKNV